MANDLTKRHADITQINPVEGYIVKRHSAFAYDKTTGKTGHPMDIDPALCVVLIAGSDVNNNSVLILVAEPPKDFLNSWNKGEYRTLSVSGIDLESSGHIPSAFSKIENNYEFNAQRVIVANDIQDALAHDFMGPSLPSSEGDNQQLILEDPK